MAATVMDLLSAIEPKAVLFLGKCGGLKTSKVGDFILPIARHQGEGAKQTTTCRGDSRSTTIVPVAKGRLGNDSQARVRLLDRHSPTRPIAVSGNTTRNSKSTLTSIRALAIDMETATIFIVGLSTTYPRVRCFLVSDSPMTPEGVKTGRSDSSVNERYVRKHLEIGMLP